MINQSDFDAHGYTGNCPQCDYIQRYGKARPGGKHSAECRARITEAIRATEAGRERVEEHEERVNRGIAERIEHADRQQVAQQQAQPGPQAAPAQSQEETAPTAPPGRLALEPAEEEKFEQDLQRAAEAPGAPRPYNPIVDDDGHAKRTTEGEDETMSDEESINDDDINMGFIGLLQPSFDDEVSEFLLQQVGSGYRREARQASKRVVSEIYSPPRVTSMLRKMAKRYNNLTPGYASDLTTKDPLDGKP